MLIDKSWNDLLPADWIAFANAWLDELRADEPNLASAHNEDAEHETVSARVVRMNFTAAPEHQWRFILEAVELATNQNELDHIAAGPIEHLLGWHGDKFIDRVEQQAATDEKFRRSLSNVWKYRMAEAVWSRVQALKVPQK